MASYDDQGDLQVLERIAKRLDRAQGTRSLALHSAVDRELQSYLMQELMEDRVEIDQARRELAQSTREARSSRQEVALNGVVGATPAVRGDDRADLRDDLRDLADDQRDLDALERIYGRRQAISQELNLLYGRFDPYAVARKRALVQDLNTLAVESARIHSLEVHEDRAEIREDRVEAYELGRR